MLSLLGCFSWFHEINLHKSYTKQELLMLTVNLKALLINTAEQWLKQAWDLENWFNPKVVQASQGKY